MKQARKAVLILSSALLTVLWSDAAQYPVAPLANTAQRSSIHTACTNKKPASDQELRNEVIKTCFPANENNAFLFKAEKEEAIPVIKHSLIFVSE